MINDVDEAVGCGDVGLNNRSIHASTFDSYRLVVVITVHDVEVKEFLFDVCWHLNNLQKGRNEMYRALDFIQKSDFTFLPHLPDYCYSTVFSRS